MSPFGCQTLRQVLGHMQQSRPASAGVRLDAPPLVPMVTDWGPQLTPVYYPIAFHRIGIPHFVHPNSFWIFEWFPFRGYDEKHLCECMFSFLSF